MSQEAQGVLWTTMMLSHACWGNCLRHALNKLPKKLATTTSLAIDANIALLNAQFDDLKEFDANDELAHVMASNPWMSPNS
jgi:hypothetical protein